MITKSSYNDGKIHLDYKSDFDKFATDFSEGNENLKKLLLTSWNLGIMTNACCVGHEDTFNGKMLYLNTDTGLPEEVSVTADEARLTYISFILDSINYEVLGSLCTHLFSKFDDKIECSIVFSSPSQANLSIYCSSSIKNDFFNFISDFLKSKTTMYCNQIVKLCASLEDILPRYLDNSSYSFILNGLSVHKSISKTDIECKNGDIETRFSYDFLGKENDIFLDVVKKDGRLLKYVPTNLSNYSSITFEAINRNVGAFEYVVPDKVDNYLDFVSFAVQKDSFSIFYIPDDIDNYSNIIFEAVKLNNDSFRFVDFNKVDNYFDIALFAVRKNGLLLSYVSSNIDNYSTIAFEAVRQNYEAFRYVDSKVNNYFEITLCAVSQNGLLLESIPSSIDGYSNIAFEAIKQNPQAFKFINVFSVYDYYEIALFALEKDCSLVRYIPTKYFKYNKLVLSVAVKKPEILKYLDYNSSIIKDVVYPVLYKNKQAYMYVPEHISINKNYKINFITYSCIKKIQNGVLKLQNKSIDDDNMSYKKI